MHLASMFVITVVQRGGWMMTSRPPTCSPSSATLQLIGPRAMALECECITGADTKINW